jgi:hypothetical protein
MHNTGLESAEIPDPIEEARRLDGRASRQEALALEQALRREGWQHTFAAYRGENYDRMSGPLSTSVSGAGYWDHPDHPGVVIRAGEGINYRAGTSWGEVCILAGERLASVQAEIATERERRAALAAEDARLAALPSVAIPGASDTDIAALYRAVGETLAGLNDACSEAGRADQLYGNREVSLQWDATKEAVYAARQAADTLHQRLMVAQIHRESLARSELQSLAPYIEAGDTELLEASGVPEGYADELAAEAEHAARTMAPPVPDVTRNAGYTVRAVMPGHPAGNDLLASWWVAAEDIADGGWVTWEAYALNGEQAGQLSYNAGHYFDGTDQAVNRRGALANLAVRAGTMPEMAHLIAAEVMRYAGNILPPSVKAEDQRMASRLRKWASR